MHILRSDTAAHIQFGPFVDKGDGVTLEVAAGIITSIDHATTGIFLSKNGAAAAIRHQNVTASVLDAYGMFQVHLDTTDTDTPGNLRVTMAEAATFLPVQEDCIVIPHELYDTLFVTQPAAAINKFFDKASPTGTVNSIPDAVAGAANGIAIVGSSVAVGSIANDAITAASIANGAIDNATFAADVGSTAAATNIISQAVELVIKENNLDHLIKTAKDTNWATTVTKESVIDLMTSKDTSQTFQRSEDSLEAIRDRGDAAWLTGAGAAADAAVFPSGVTKVVGGTLTGDHTKLTIIDADYCSLVETTTTTLLELNVAFAATAKSLAVGLRVWGYYSGSQTHYIRVQALDQIGGTVYEDVGLMPNASVVTAYIYDLGPNHIHATTGAVAIKFLHSPPGTGIGNHVLYLDKVYVSTISPVVNLTAAEVVDAWETQSQADPTGFHVNILEVNGTGQTAGNLQALLVDIPTVAEFELRTLPAADYTIVSDLGTVQTGDSFAVVSSATKGVAKVYDDMATSTALAAAKTVVDNISTAVITNAAGTDVAADIIALKAVADLIEDINRNKLEVTKATGAATLYADNSSTPLLTNSITEDVTTTTRTRLE